MMGFKFNRLVYPVRKECMISLEPVFPLTVSADNEYFIEIRPMSGLRRYGLRNSGCAPTDADVEFFSAKHRLNVTDGALTIRVSLPQEDRYFCNIYVGEARTEILQIYALEEDLLSRTPFKGDNHMHTWMSDGKDSPMYMAAMCCRRGYDYCVITDHHKYEPSLIARDFYKGTNVDFLVIPGEEVHSPDNPVHIINLGGDESVNAWFQNHEDEYRAAVDAELAKMDAPMVEKDRYAAAASQVIFDRIKSVDGVAVLCHPGWILANGFNETEDITDYLFDNRRFDALELIAGGAFEDGTQLQISYYHDRETMPVLGDSDSHNCFGGRLEPGNYTIVFARELTAVGIKEAVRKGLAIAGNENKLYGDYRLVKYGYFLLQNYYPEHDRLREQLGSRMLRLASSGLGADSELGTVLADPRPSELFKAVKL